MTLLDFDRDFPGPVLGLDEVGLGCIAGPIVAAGVVLPEEPALLETLLKMGINDSKQLRPGTRERIVELLDEHLVYSQVLSADVGIIEKRGLYPCLDTLYIRIVHHFRQTVCPKTVLLDGKTRQTLPFVHTAVVKGDTKSLAVAAASIVAKVFRDNYMAALHRHYPAYHLDKHKGYPTPEHLKALQTFGLSDIHRKGPAQKFLTKTLPHDPSHET